MSDSFLKITLQGPELSSAAEFLRTTSRPTCTPSNESKLLHSIRLALRGSDTDLLSSVQSTSLLCGDDPVARQLTWNARNVILSYGGVMKKRWSFPDEAQSIQWACLGELEQTYPSASTPSAAHYTGGSAAPKPSGLDERHTFGPFSRVQNSPKTAPAQPQNVPAIFVFMRSLGMVILENGLNYTFSLPFIVRKAWPISPHGVMLQRVLEPAEILEAEMSGEAALPTIFSFTSPLAEPSAVGLTAGIVGGYDSPPALKDEEENSINTLKSIPPTEMVITTSHRSPASSDDIVVTMDVANRTLSIWRYVYIKPKDAPVPFTRKTTTSKAKARQSMGGAGSRRTSAIFNDMSARIDRLHPVSPKLRSRDPSPTPELFELPVMPPLSSLPGMAPALSTTTTLQSLASATDTVTTSSKWSAVPKKGARRNSLTRNDLSVTLDKMALGGKEIEAPFIPLDNGRMRAAYWMEKLYSQEVPEADATSWREISVALFDNRFDGTAERSLMSICIPKSQTMLLFSVVHAEDKITKIKSLSQIAAVSAVPIRATRESVYDLLFVNPNGGVSLLTHGLREVPLNIDRSALNLQLNSGRMEIDDNTTFGRGKVVGVEDAIHSSATLVFGDGVFEKSWKSRAHFELFPKDSLTKDCIQMLARTIPAEASFHLHATFLKFWAFRNFSSADNMEFNCFTEALYSVFDLPNSGPVASNPWIRLAQSSSHVRFQDDPVLKRLQLPSTPAIQPIITDQHPNKLLAPILYTLHTLAEYLRLRVARFDDILRIAPVICRIALVIRPEWADYWKRLVPDVPIAWPSPTTNVTAHLDDRLAVWPSDMSAVLYGRISAPEWKGSFIDTEHIATRFHTIPSFEYGHCDPLAELHELRMLYTDFCEGRKFTLERCQKAISTMVSRLGPSFLDSLPLGAAAPLREAARTCQLSPPADWPLETYRAIGRNDLAASASDSYDTSSSNGYRPIKEFMNPSRRRKAVSDIVAETKSAAAGEVDAVSGVELNLRDFTDIRFGQDRRLEEVARILCSSIIPTIKILERPELNEHDQTREYQNQVARVAERTLAQPYGRAMYTFGSVANITREAYTIPKLEYSVRIQPLNITVALEPGKLAPESLSWGEFHNGVAAGLRISPTSGGVESSWIAFNKPSELTPEHAGFLLGLGLTGHLKGMLTWHTFSYLTPKHDLTSIAILLGLSAANIGNGNEHVTKLLAVHTPALLPTPNVDLNVSLLTQAAGLFGVGLLYMGTRNRRMAEVCLNQLCRRDLVQPDLSNEHREAYTYAAGLAFGMIMLGKGTTIPADVAFLDRMSVLIHGDANQVQGAKRPPFDINLTSPSATIGLGLMYLRTERQDIADILAIPDTVISLNRIQPGFLLIRTIARSLIMWNSIAPTNEWLIAQIPSTIREAIEMRAKHKNIDDAMELAYYNILAGCCFVVALKFAGTASQDAYVMIVRYFDLFTRLVYSNGPAFDHKIKRSAVRDGLNLISISLSMVMAGTGEISCLRRLRYSYGMYQQAMYVHGFKYGVHVSTYQAMGLLFLGGGRYTLGTSNAAIACMVTAFFPRFHHFSSDNKSFLQALRHMWVLSVEPRCLIARDVDTNEVVYLPVKIAVREEKGDAETQLISPTLIPDVDRITRVRVDTPRYWPFYLDTEGIARHRDVLLKSQTLFVKRRTAFLSYTEDPRGSRSLFVRSGSSTGDAATLDYPQLKDTKTHPASDLSEFITSFSNDILFLAFADHFSRHEGDTPEESLFHTYCHAALLDSILQDKPQTLQTHLTLYLYRNMQPTSRYFHLRLQDLRFASDFYSRVYERRFGGRQDVAAPRPPLVRDTTVLGAMHAIDERLEEVRNRPEFVEILRRYVTGVVLFVEGVPTDPVQVRELAWYLGRNGVPVAAVLVALHRMAHQMHAQCVSNLVGVGAGEGVPMEGATNPTVEGAVSPPVGPVDMRALEGGIKEVLYATGSKMTTVMGTGWSVRSLEEILKAWVAAESGAQVQV
ncbi:hypothetical protein BDQ12DRAFT_713446 [Crucibulum laeve]|uniref:Uncharacterized protein n=1 Tax=Crucibulum laeve TaxID=68775 RepID=A0A5C3LYN4_9AGAR|nr:hypothetical protein BDQ12DRAFT_713446 [Crucibulum laeve]